MIIFSVASLSGEVFQLTSAKPGIKVFIKGAWVDFPPPIILICMQLLILNEGIAEAGGTLHRVD